MITQGDWKAGLTPFGFCVLAGDICTAVAERYFDRKPTATELRELHDNARLIAAAPRTKRERDKLLEACKAMVKLTLDQTALELDKRGQIDDLCSALTVCTTQFNSQAVKNANIAIAEAESEA